MDYENQLLGIARGRAVAFALAIARGGGGGESTILGDRPGRGAGNLLF